MEFLEYSCVDPKAIIICFHGGNFSGGSMEYDIDQNNALSSAGYKVIQPEFPKKFSEFKVWAKKFIEPFSKQTLPVNVIGRSSGGYLAKYVYDNYKFIMRAFYICPVFYPSSRCIEIPKFVKGTDEFFDVPEDYLGTFRVNEFTVISTVDANVPVEYFKYVPNIVHQSELSHSDTIKRSDKSFISLIDLCFTGLCSN